MLAALITMLCILSRYADTQLDKGLSNSQNTLLRARAYIRGDVAQLGEHHVRNVGVVGSNPIISTTSTTYELAFCGKEFVLRIR